MSDPPSWLRDFGLARARRNLRVEFGGDWFRDPWGWPEIGWLSESPASAHIAARIRADDTFRGYALDVPKENFGTRPACILHPLDRLTYQAVVDFSSVRLAGDLHPFVCGWRLRRDIVAPGEYAHNSFEWTNHRRHLVEFSRRYQFALTTDIVSFFASISLDRVGELVARRTRESRAQRRLLNYLATFETATDRPGLPQRALASSLIANAFLSPLDDLLRARSQSVARRGRAETHSVVRWMDDIWLFGNDLGSLRRSQLEIESALWDLGLVLNSGKTEILEGEDLQARAREREHSAVDAQLTRSSGNDTSALGDLVEQILASPERVSRSTYRFVLGRVERWGMTQVLRSLATVAHQAPHAADSFSHAFRRLGLVNEVADWYLEYRDSLWMRDLACAHLGAMFERAVCPSAAVVSALESDCLSSSLPRSSVALTRLAAWDAGQVRLLIREAARNADHALLRRALALVALGAQEERPLIRRLLRSHPENGPLLELLEVRRFRPFELSQGF